MVCRSLEMAWTSTVTPLSLPNLSANGLRAAVRLSSAQITSLPPAALAGMPVRGRLRRCCRHSRTAASARAEDGDHTRGTDAHRYSCRHGGLRRGKRRPARWDRPESSANRRSDAAPLVSHVAGTLARRCSEWKGLQDCTQEPLLVGYSAAMRARLSDIAQQAEVSEATVSRVLNDRPGVAPETRQAVLTALDVLGYERPARLRKRSAGLVGLVVPELDNPIFPAFAQVIESALAQSGYTPVLCTQTPGGVTEDEYVEMLLDRQVSGIVFVSGLHADTAADHDRYRALIARPLPIVLINGYAAGIAGAVRLLRRPGGRPSWPWPTWSRSATGGSA